MMPPVAHYQEFAPCEALREHVCAFFSFAPLLQHSPRGRRLFREVRLMAQDPSRGLFLADGRISLTFEFEQAWVPGDHWRRVVSAPRGKIIGAMSAGGVAIDEYPEAVGAFLRAGGAFAVIGVPPSELTDRIVAVEDLWGPTAADLPSELAAASAPARIDRLESVLLRRLAQAPAAEVSLDVSAMAQRISRTRGRLKIEQLAKAAGVSRQHLSRSFRKAVGITPKLYARLARFQAGLSYAGCGAGINWAQVALELGYADQSHMIADFREFGSLTPETLARQRWFHPYIERARSIRSRATGGPLQSDQGNTQWNCGLSG